MFLLVPAYPGCPGSKAVKRSLLLLSVNYNNLMPTFCSCFIGYRKQCFNSGELWAGFLCQFSSGIFTRFELCIRVRRGCVINFESLVSINWKTIFIKMAVVLVMWIFQKAVPLKELLPCLLFISQQMFPILHKWRYYDARARDRIGL